MSTKNLTTIIIWKEEVSFYLYWKYRIVNSDNAADDMAIACSETNYELDGSFNKDDWTPSVATSFIMSKVSAIPAIYFEFVSLCGTWWDQGAYFNWSETIGKACYAESNPKNIAELRKRRNFMQMLHAGSGTQTISCASIDCAATNSGKKVIYCEVKPAFDIESKVFNKEHICKMRNQVVSGCNGAEVNCEAPTPAPKPGPTPAPIPGPTPAPIPGPTPAPIPGPTPAPLPGPTTPNKTTSKQPPVASVTSPRQPHVLHTTPLANAAERVIYPLMVAFGAPLILTLTIAINKHLF